MIDHIKSIGNFVEFELLYDYNDKNIDELQILLNKFIEQFNELNFESANLPYRDFVAQKNYIGILPTKDLKTIILDLNEINVDNEFVTNIELLQILRKKGIKLFLTSNSDIQNIIEKYELPKIDFSIAYNEKYVNKTAKKFAEFLIEENKSENRSSYEKKY